MSCRSNPGNSLVTSLARSVIGTSDKEVQNLFHAKVREYKEQTGSRFRLLARQPQAEQEEVETWLQSTRRWIESSPMQSQVPQAQRERWLAKLDELTPNSGSGTGASPQAQSKYRPDAATFYAWQRVVNYARSHNTAYSPQVTPALEQKARNSFPNIHENLLNRFKEDMMQKLRHRFFLFHLEAERKPELAPPPGWVELQDLIEVIPSDFPRSRAALFALYAAEQEAKKLGQEYIELYA
jgi:hypothetical protein